jgi:hypothetical protein
MVVNEWSWLFLFQQEQVSQGRDSSKERRTIDLISIPKNREGRGLFYSSSSRVLDLKPNRTFSLTPAAILFLFRTQTQLISANSMLHTIHIDIMLVLFCL